MGELAQKAGLSRSGLYKALGEGGNPSFETVAGLLKAFGVRLTVAQTQA
jgi:probable addiction module antidote protein